MKIISIVSCLLTLTLFGTKVCADEFIGPMVGWSNAKTNYGAVGNGSHDDTSALQAALNDVGTPGHSNTLYLPAGTYCISGTLSLASRSGVSILGENPTNTTIKWIGGQTTSAMMSVNGVWYSRYGRLTWDGAGLAQTAWYDYWDGNSNYFPTHNEHADEVFKNVAFGMRVGQHQTGFGSNTGDAEAAVLRCKFMNCSTAGLSIQDPNALDWFVWYCTFDHCGLGVTNNPPGGGAGNFHVYNSVFRSSNVADVSIGNTGYFSLRSNYSLGSKQFFVASWYGNNAAQITLQKNTVLDTQSTSVQVENAGPVMLIDNVIRAAAGFTGAQVRVGVGANQEDTISVGNTYTVANPINAGGRVRAVNDTVVDRGTINPAEPTLPGVLPNNNRYIYEVSSTGTGADIQTAVNAAFSQRNGQRAVVHVPRGDHSVAQTIQVPAGADLQLVGDGFGVINGTTLTWAGPAAGPVLALNRPSRATVRDLQVVGAGANTGIAAYVGDQSGDRVFIEQGDVDLNTQAGLLSSGLSNTLVELHDFYHGNSSGSSVSVAGTNGQGSGRLDLFGGDGSNNSGTSYNITGNGRLLVQDVWYEAHPTGPGFIHLTGSGMLTIQGGHIATVTASATPAISIDGFTGTASLIGLSASANYSSLPSKMVIQANTGAGANILALGDWGDSDSWFVNNSTNAQVSFLSNKASDASGSKQLANTGRQDDTFLLQGLAQTRSEYPSVSPLAAVPSGGSDIRFYRVRSVSGNGSASPSAFNICIAKTVPQSMTYQAESGYLEHGAAIYSDTVASGGQVVGGMQNAGAADTLGGINGGVGGNYTLTIHYANGGSTATKHFFINGVEIGQLNFASTGNWTGSYGNVTASVQLNAGSNNSFSIQNFGGDLGSVNLDTFAFASQ